MVNPLALTGTAIAGVTTTYGTAAAAGAVTFSNNFAADVLSATAGIDNQALSTSSNLRAGTYTQTVSAISGADALNYSFTPFTTGSATYVVNPLALTGTAIAGVTTTYGTAAAAGAVSFSNNVAADVLSATAGIDNQHSAPAATSGQEPIPRPSQPSPVPTH